MPKLRVLSASEVCKILQKHGFVRVRQTGSHIIMRRQLPDRGITVPDSTQGTQGNDQEGT
jgi:predicted RNA binding protein YcfA (HicA-like mRNA interferase family)